MKLETLVQECLAGRQEAWEMLVTTFSKRIFNMAYQFSGSYEEAEDLTQEVFMKLHHSLSKYDTEKNFTAWLLTLAKNHLIDTYRRTKWEKKNRDDFDEHLSGASSLDSPENVLIKEENKRIVWEGLNSLSPDIRMILILRDIQGKAYEEISQIMNLPLGTVKSRINRGRLQLAGFLRENKGDIR